MIKKSLLVVISVTLLTGCLQKNILDDIRLVTAVGYDALNDGEVKITTVVPLFKPDQSTESETHTDVARLTTEVSNDLSKTTSKPFVSGKLEVILYDSELAEKGLSPFTDILLRDPSIGSRAFIAISNHDVNQLLSGQYGSQDNGMYISDMINQNVEAGLLPDTNLHLWLNGFYAKGSDPYAPIIDPYNDKIKITGLALFKDDQMVGDIPSAYLFTFKTLVQPKSKRGVFITELENGNIASIYKVNGKRKIKVEGQNQTPKFTINIDLNGIIREYSGEVVEEKVKKQIEKSIEEKMEKQANEMFTQIKELNVDPIGFGEVLRSQTRQWNAQQWYDQYPNSDISINVNVKITETGIVN